MTSMTVQQRKYLQKIRDLVLEEIMDEIEDISAQLKEARTLLDTERMRCAISGQQLGEEFESLRQAKIGHLEQHCDTLNEELVWARDFDPTVHPELLES